MSEVCALSPKKKDTSDSGALFPSDQRPPACAEAAKAPVSRPNLGTRGPGYLQIGSFMPREGGGGEGGGEGEGGGGEGEGGRGGGGDHLSSKEPPRVKAAVPVAFLSLDYFERCRAVGDRAF